MTRTLISLVMLGALGCATSDACSLKHDAKAASCAIVCGSKKVILFPPPCEMDKFPSWNPQAIVDSPIPKSDPSESPIRERTLPQ